MNRFQEAFYRDAVDITDNGSYPELVAGSEIDTPRFLAETAGEGAKARTWRDFGVAGELGVSGFPTVLLRVDGSTQVLSRGYAPLDHFESQLSFWVEGRQPDRQAPTPAQSMTPPAEVAIPRGICPGG
ncbi:MAG: hypothetical protein GY722_19155 [bacterium]|nr:hypothetical protein [bacterium]